jgi:hypothetical protein
VGGMLIESFNDRKGPKGVFRFAPTADIVAAAKLPILPCRKVVKLVSFHWDICDRLWSTFVVAANFLKD